MTAARKKSRGDVYPFRFPCEVVVSDARRKHTVYTEVSCLIDVELSDLMRVSVPTEDVNSFFHLLDDEDVGWYLNLNGESVELDMRPETLSTVNGECLLLDAGHHGGIIEAVMSAYLEDSYD